MPEEYASFYEEVTRIVGGAGNIATLGACMTRLRFTLKSQEGISLQDLKKVPGVLGYVQAQGQHQVVVGASKAGKLLAYFQSRHSFAPLGEEPSAPSAQEVKAAVRQKYASRLGRVCARIGNIFVPLIPAYIGCGLLLGIGNILGETLLKGSPNAVGLMQALGNGIFFYLNAIVGYNASREFGGTPALGAALAGVLNIPSLASVTLFGLPLIPGKGGVIAVLVVCWAAAYVEKFLRARVKGSMELFVTPTLTILLVGIVSLAVIQPAAGWFSDKLALWTQHALKNGAWFTGAVLGGGFLPLVMLGVHQSLVPLHQQLVDTLGNNPLFPVLCMAGAGQVGAGLAVILKTRNERLKTVAKNALPVGLLGIGEPLIYGVTLPLFKPFIAACIGAAAGGAVVAALHVTAAIPFGVSGVVMFLALSNLHSVIFYGVGFVTAVACGFGASWKMGFEDPQN